MNHLAPSLDSTIPPAPTPFPGMRAGAPRLIWRCAIAAVLLTAAVLGQTARFPTAVATNSDLTDLADRAQTQLTGSLNSSATSFTVTSAARFAANMILSIDSEQIKVCSIVGTTVNIGHSSCPNVDGRGFAGTTAASHSSGSLVSDYFVAYQFKALRNELVAVETALGANLLNVVPASPSLMSSAYNFTSQTPAGTLSAGNNTITMVPVPRGLNGSDGWGCNTTTGVGCHQLYVAGTGTPEVCFITGGTGTSNQDSGQIIIKCANTHSAGWTIRSATEGMQEAAVALGSDGGVVSVSRGDQDVYGTATVPAKVYIMGAGPHATTVWANTTGRDVFYVYASGSGVSGMTIDSRVGSRTGSGIVTNTSLIDLYFGEVIVMTQNVGIAMNSAGYIFKCIGGPNNTIGVVLNSNEIYGVEVQANSNASYGFEILNGTGIYLTHPQATQNGTSNYFATGGAANVFIAADRLLSSQSGGHGVDLRGTGLGLVLELTNPFIELSGRLSGTVADKSGIVYESAALFQVVGGLVDGNTGPGILAGPSGGATDAFVLSGVHVAGNGISVGTANDAAGVKLAGSIAWTSITGNVIKAQLHSLWISSAAIANGFTITGNYFDATGTPLYSPSGFASAKPNQLQPNFWGNSSFPTYASATTVTLAPQDVDCKISGTTTTTTLGDGWLGRSVRLIKTDSGSLTVGGGGNIPLSHTMTQNTALTLTYDGSNWY